MKVRVRVRVRVRVGRVAPAEAVELGTRDGAWRVAGERGCALRDGHHDHQRVGLADGALLGHVAPRVVGHLDRDLVRVRARVRFRARVRVKFRGRGKNRGRVRIV